ncbi:hypothetical protein LXL04_023322 [Taraxacum kok-saghyz]
MVPKLSLILIVFPVKLRGDVRGLRIRLCVRLSANIFLGILRTSEFMENIRAYNMMFSMTSFEAKIDDSTNFGGGPYTFKISGQISHWLESICPSDDSPPRSLQLFIYDTKNEVTNRMRFYNWEGSSSLNANIVNRLSKLQKKGHGLNYMERRLD